MPTPAAEEIEVEELGSCFKVKDSKITSGLQGGAEGQLIFLASFWLTGKALISRISFQMLSDYPNFRDLICGSKKSRLLLGGDVVGVSLSTLTVLVESGGVSSKKNLLGKMWN